ERYCPHLFRVCRAARARGKEVKRKRISGEGMERTIENQIKELTGKYGGDQVSNYLNNLSVFLERRKENSSRGGRAKGENGYAKFVTWVHDNNFSVSEYACVSIAQFAIVLNRKGFKVSEVTADKYRKKYLT